MRYAQIASNNDQSVVSIRTDVNFLYSDKLQLD
jgi:hypothetical protein